MVLDQRSVRALERVGTLTVMADIGRPEREIEVRPAELPLPRELPIEPPLPAPGEPSPATHPVPA